jgi:hypothetical protein
MADVNQEILVKLKAIDELTPVMLQALQAMQANSARMAEALDKVGAASNRTAKNTDGLKGGVISLQAAWELLKDGAEIVGQAIQFVWGQLNRAWHEALEGEKATNRLTGAMIQAGVYTKATDEQLDKYIDSLEELKGANGETVKSMIATGLQFGLTLDKSKELEQAARQLAAAQGVDVQTAFNALKGSLNGNTRALAQMVPQVKELGSAQLKTGAAIDLVNKATKAQYEIYQDSLPASLTKAQVAIDNLYKAVGEAFTDNAGVTAGIAVIVDGLQALARIAKDNQDILRSWVTGGILFVLDALAVLNTVFDAVYRVGTIAFEGIKGAIYTLSLGIQTIIDGPILAFYKALSYLPGEKGQAFNAAAEKIIGNMAETAAVVNGSADAINRAMTDQTEAAKLVETGILKVRDAVVLADAAEKQNNDTKTTAQEKAAALAAANLALHQSYAGIDIGTRKQREALEGQVQDRDREFKQFEEYLNNRLRLAVDKQQEQEQKLAELRAKNVTSGPEGKVAGAEAAIEAEESKQQRLTEKQRSGLLTRAQAEAEMRASEQAIREQELVIATAHQQAMAEALGEGPQSLAARAAIKEQQFQEDLARRTTQAQMEGATEEQIHQMKLQQRATHEQQMREMVAAAKQQEIDLLFQKDQERAQTLGDTEEGFALRQSLAEGRHQFELQEKLRRAQEMGATDLEMQALREQSDLEHKANMRSAEENFWNQQAQTHARAGNEWDAFLATMRASQVKHGQAMGTLMAVQNSEQYKGAKQMFGDLATLRNSKSKTAFEIGKKAAIAEATVNTFEAATKAYSSLAAIPIVGPALGAIAAGAAIAAGLMNIQKISAQKFDPGGQADSGMDFIPQQLSGKSFVLSGGERVVQPTANRDLTAFLAGQNPNAPSARDGSGGQYNITLHYNGNGSEGDARRMAEMVMKEIRSASERGTQVINSKGVYG